MGKVAVKKSDSKAEESDSKDGEGKQEWTPAVIKNLQAKRTAEMIELGQLTEKLGGEFGPTRLLVPGAKMNPIISKHPMYIKYQSVNAKNCERAAVRDELKTQCWYCGQVCSSRRTTAHHVQMIHTGEPPRVYCPHCGVSFSSGSNLKAHVKYVCKGPKKQN